MSDLRALCILILILISTSVWFASAQSKDSTYKILIESGGGYGLSKDSASQSVTRYGFSGMLRIMWKPDHRLKVGIETGWLRIASLDEEEIKNEFGTVKLNASLNAIPVMAVFDMDIWRLNLYTGLGYYYVLSTISVENEKITNTKWNIGFYLALAYKYPISEKIKLCGDLKWCSIGELGKTILLAEVFISYNLFEW
jgi:hypothetical protein